MMDIYTHPGLYGIAVEYHERYLSFVEAGFDTDQAFSLTVLHYQAVLMASLYAPNPNA